MSPLFWIVVTALVVLVIVGAVALGMRIGKRSAKVGVTNPDRLYDSKSTKVRKQVTQRDNLLRRFTNAGNKCIQLKEYHGLISDMIAVAKGEEKRVDPSGRVEYGDETALTAFIEVAINLRLPKPISIYYRSETLDQNGRAVYSPINTARPPERFGSTEDEVQRAVEFVLDRLRWTATDRKLVRDHVAERKFIQH